MSAEGASGPSIAAEKPSDPLTGPPSRAEAVPALPPMREALRPYAGPIVVLSLLLACLLAGVAIVLLGARQPSLVISSTDPPIDSFSRADSATLGKAPGGPVWSTTGRWGIFNGTASLSEAAPGKVLSAATTDLGSPDAEISAKLIGVDGSGGVVFRYRNASNYGIFLPAPLFGTWQLRIVQNGKTTLEKNVGLTSSQDGSIGAVVASGTSVTTLVDNKIVDSVSIPDGLDGTRFGFGSVPGAATKTRFDDVVAMAKADR